MGAALDLKVVAEGIERRSQVERLREAGCTLGQGYLFGRPQPLPETLRALRAGLPGGRVDGAPGRVAGDELLARGGDTRRAVWWPGSRLPFIPTVT